MQVEWTRLENMTSWKTTMHEVSVPKGYRDGKRVCHKMLVDSEGNVAARGRTCCDNRQYGCAYLGSCTAQKPQDIPLGHITDYPIIE